MAEQTIGTHLKPGEERQFVLGQDAAFGFNKRFGVGGSGNTSFKLTIIDSNSSGVLVRNPVDDRSRPIFLPWASIGLVC